MKKTKIPHTDVRNSTMGFISFNMQIFMVTQLYTGRHNVTFVSLSGKTDIV